MLSAGIFTFQLICVELIISLISIFSHKLQMASKVQFYDKHKGLLTDPEDGDM
jgi:hypothetical protein